MYLCGDMRQHLLWMSVTHRCVLASVWDRDCFYRETVSLCCCFLFLRGRFVCEEGVCSNRKSWTRSRALPVLLSRTSLSPWAPSSRPWVDSEEGHPRLARLPGTHGRVALGVFRLPHASSRPHLLAQLREGIAAGQVAVGTGDRLSPLAQAPPPASMCLTREDQGEFSKSQLQEKLK